MEEERRKRRKISRGYEENTMAIIDASGLKHARDVEDDRLSFLEAVRQGSIISEDASMPTRRMYEAIFQILNDGTSLELMMESFELLVKLTKRFPRVYISHTEKSEASIRSSIEAVVDEEAWSPFIIGPEYGSSEEAGSRNYFEPVDSHRFFLLIQDLAKAVCEKDFQLQRTKVMRDMLMFQFLFNVLEGDFVPRCNVYKETMNWALLRDSSLHVLLGSRRINFKSLVKECMHIIAVRSDYYSGINPHELRKEEAVDDCDVALAIAVVEQENQMHFSVQKFLNLIMEVDAIKKEVGSLAFASRTSGYRTPILEVIQDELTYNKDLLSPFLQEFSEPKWKLEISLRYLLKYFTKPSTRRRSSSDSEESATLESVLKCFSNNTSARSIVRKIGTELAQILLAHSFQAYLSIQDGLKEISSNNQNNKGALLQICNGIISAFQNIRKINGLLEIRPFEKEALFTAATILSTMSNLKGCR